VGAIPYNTYNYVLSIQSSRPLCRPEGCALFSPRPAPHPPRVAPPTTVHTLHTPTRRLQPGVILFTWQHQMGTERKRQALNKQKRALTGADAQAQPAAPALAKIKKKSSKRLPASRLKASRRPLNGSTKKKHLATLKPGAAKKAAAAAAAAAAATTHAY
jgi:hypothetical protein